MFKDWNCKTHKPECTGRYLLPWENITSCMGHTSYVLYHWAAPGSRTAPSQKKERQSWLQLPDSQMQHSSSNQKRAIFSKEYKQAPETQSGKTEASSSLFVWAQRQN